MLAIEIHRMLMKIAETTYPDNEILKFFIEIIPSESKTRHGDYAPHQRKIRIFNLSRKTSYIIKTTIHELAHHCEYSIYKTTGHNKRFYKVYKQLLETAIKMGLVTYEEVRTVNDSNDINVLEQHYGPITVQFDPSMAYKKDLYMIKVFNSYSIKEKLSNRGYSYNGIEQSWYKEIEEQDLEKEKNFVYSIMKNKNNVLITDARDITIDAVYYIAVDNAFSHKDILKKRGYIFKGYNYKSNVWVKKIKAKELKEEEYFLKYLGLKYKVKGKK